MKESFTQIRAQIIEEHLIPYRCARCGCDGEWQGELLTLELHHIDGDRSNNNLENLQFLCPNCHALTKNYGSKNRHNSFDETIFITHINNGLTIRQALLKMHLSDGSANYRHAYDILNKYHIDYTAYVNTDSATHCMRCGKIVTTGAQYCKECCQELQRIAERPTPDELLKMIATTSFVEVGRKYGVSDNAVRKWCKGYGLPTKKAEIVQLYQESMKG